MQNIFTGPETCVEGYGRIIPMISLNKHHPGAAIDSNSSDSIDQQRCDMAPAMVFQNRQIIDVYLRAFLLQLCHFIGCKPANNFSIDLRNQRNEIIASQQFFEIHVSGSTGIISIPILERRSKNT